MRDRLRVRRRSARPDPRVHGAEGGSRAAPRHGDAPPGAGAAPRVLHAVLEVSEQGFPFRELCLARAGEREVGLCSFFPRKTEVPATVSYYEGDGTWRGFLRALRRARGSGRYDVVHAHTPHVAVLALLSERLAPGRRKERWPMVFTAHHSFTNSNLRFRNRLMLLPIFATFSRVVCVGEAARASFPRTYRRLAGPRLHTIRNGVDHRNIDEVLRDVSGPRRDGFTIVCVGRLIPIKNPLALLEAFHRADLPEARLVFIGRGEEEANLRARISALGLEGRVELQGLVAREEVYRSFFQADLFVSMSRGEGMPLAVLEAMACGRPVVLSDIPPHREIAQDADCVPLLDPDDVPALAEQIRRYAGRSPEELRAIGRRCRALSEARFSLPEIHARYERLYMDALASHGLSPDGRPEAARAEERPQICHVISSFRPVIGGAELATERLCLRLVHEGARVVVLTRAQPGCPRSETVQGLEIRRAGVAASGKWGTLTFAASCLWLLLTRYRHLRILHVQNIDAPLLLGIVARTLSRRALIATIHGQPMILLKKRSWLGRARVRLMARTVDLFTALDPAMRDQLLMEGIPTHRIHMIPNGVDTKVLRPASVAEKGRLRRRLGITPSALLVVFVGRLVALKQVDQLIRVWPGLGSGGPRELLIVGDGPERDRLVRISATTSSIRFTGSVSDASPYLRCADIFVLPSRQEGLSVALLEAMAAGLTVVVSDLPGNGAVVQDGENGLLFRQGDLESLSETLEKAVTSAELRRRCGDSARRTACSLYSLDAVAERHVALYRGLVAVAPGATR